MAASAVEEERFLVLTDGMARTWIEGKTNDIERWLRGMRQLAEMIESEGGRDG